MVSSVNPSVASFIRGGDSGIVRMPPEPRSRLKLDFGSILSSVGSMVGSAASSTLGGIRPELMDLINKQVEMQEEMQMVSLTSNVEKSRHESQMAAIRNIRAG